MANMQKEYGADKGKRVFYATMNKRKHDAPAAPKSDKYGIRKP